MSWTTSTGYEARYRQGMANRHLAAMLVVAGISGCSSGTPWETGVPVRHGGVPTRDEFVGVDRWEVVVCRVPDGTRDETFVTSAERLALGADEIVERLEEVSAYFFRWSQGRLSIEWAAASDVVIDVDETSYDCVDRAIEASAVDTNAVLVIADAQHSVDAPGGWGRRGDRCERPCSVTTSRRAAYVGASDFTSYWEEASPLDLVEHEVGHAFGWPHSASRAGIGDNHVYDSDLDLMSNSAAPRAIDSARRHAPGVLAFNAWAAGWLPDDDIVFYSLDEVRVGDWQDARRLSPSDARSEEDLVRLVIVDVGTTLVTIELLADRGDNDHVSGPGVAIHEIVFDENAPEGRWHVLQAAGTEGSPLLGSGERWESDDGQLSVQLSTIEIGDSGEVSTDLRIRRNRPSSEAMSARD